MANRDAVIQRYTRGYNEVRAHYDADELDEAVTKAEELLQNFDLPRYNRIKLLTLVAAAIDDWDEADRLLETADTLWHMARQFRPVGGADPIMEELREDLDAIQADHEAARPEEFDIFDDTSDSED